MRRAFPPKVVSSVGEPDPAARYYGWANDGAKSQDCICPDEEGCSPADGCPVHDPITEVVWADVDEDVDWW